MTNVAVLGFGTVGSGVFEVIRENNKQVSQKAMDDVQVKYVLDLRDFPGNPVEEVLVHDYQVILDDPELDVVCETMGGLKPAYEFSKQALLKGKSVCTSNKELVAQHGPELLQIAREHNCNYLFEASVGGGIPIIRAIEECLTPEKIVKIQGILNGTTNYILTKMAMDGSNFEEVLKEAQAKGYAEKNPEADVEGHDARRKIAILSSLMTQKTVDYKEVYTEGITKITAKDFLYVNQMKKAIKLLATGLNDNGKIYAMVAPFIIPNTHALYNVNGVFNAVFVEGNMLGETMYYGQGAGKLATASAVVADVIAIAKNKGENIPCYWMQDTIELESVEEFKCKFFVRIKGTVESMRSKLEAKFGEIEIMTLPNETEEFAMITKVMTEKEFSTGIKDMKEIITRIRMTEE